MKIPLVSVIIASYNHERYVAQSIESVLRQTYKNIELIVIDDGSKDSSADVIQKLQKTHGFVFEVQENMGLAKTLNKAISMSQGEYIIPFGSDDIMMLDRLEKQVAYMQANSDVGICGGNILTIDETQTVVAKQDIYPERKLVFDDIYLKQIKGVPAPTMMLLRKALIEAGGFNPEIRLEDLYIEFKITALGYKIGMLNDVLAYYRIHADNTYNNLNVMLEAVLKTYECFSDHPEYEKMKVRTLQSYLLMAVKADKKLAKEILKDIPFKHYNLKILRGIAKLLT